jgi:glycosyltransferase involved in cell wall biosynthesis
MNKIELSIIVPVFNEEKTVALVLKELKDVMRLSSMNYEIIVINDGSSDKSQKIIEAFGDIRVITHEENMGYGASLKTGIRQAIYEWILIIDSDGTYPTKSIGMLLGETEKNDLIIGSRETDVNAMQIERKHAVKIINVLASYLSGEKIPDINSGLRLFKKSIVIKYWSLFPDKYSFTSTLTLICATQGYATKYIPIDYYYRVGKSNIRAMDFFYFLKIITKLSLFFKPFKVFMPISIFFVFFAFLLVFEYFFGFNDEFRDTTFIVVCLTALQTFFFGLLAEIIIYNR